MHAAHQFASFLLENGLLENVVRVQTELYGSLAATGKGHGTPKAILLGLEGETPEDVLVESIEERVSFIKSTSSLQLMGQKRIDYCHKQDLLFNRQEVLPFHPNGMAFKAFDENEEVLHQTTFYSIGGGFVVDETAGNETVIVEDKTAVPYPFSTAKELLDLCEKTGLSVSSLMLENEKSWLNEDEVKARLLELWNVMTISIEKGCQTEGVMPGGLKVKRRASSLYRQLKNKKTTTEADPLNILDWVTLYALAVNEENASGGRIVTAPTNGAAGIIPSVLRYYLEFNEGANKSDIYRFLLTAAAIGILYKTNASISGAEVGCQGEVGSACSMAAAALTDVLGGSPKQVENAAEIAMEHNLGLTCDPIGGLVQIPCIERNAMASVKAIHAARIALRGDGSHFVSLDKVIKTMRETGLDMQDKYKETARGGLAMHVLEVPVNIIEC